MRYKSKRDQLNEKLTEASNAKSYAKAQYEKAKKRRDRKENWGFFAVSLWTVELWLLLYEAKVAKEIYDAICNYEDMLFEEKNKLND